MKIRSSIWNHFTKVGEKGKCNYCNALLSMTSGSMSNLKRHLKAKHPLIDLQHIKEEVQVAVEEIVQEKVDEMSDSGNISPLKTSGVHMSCQEGKNLNAFLKKPDFEQKQEMNKLWISNGRKFIKGKDDYSIYGKNIASRMRRADKSHRAVAIAKNHIDNVIFKLEMGDFDDPVHSNENVDHSDNYPVLAEFITVRTEVAENNVSEEK
ncbi:uncharacterized protein LOC106664883 [Cimex lectularius]|uniref:BED-type domain-containing protein n=1 Tax=Cimex lectularius TaxID=79782 RepID=A0A8I6RQP9_CIMLE|nr:uncharacterized protein LOC106664883 [Cimex lectularius]